MDLEEIINQLKSLKDFCDVSNEECPAEENVWKQDSVALKKAIDILRRVACEYNAFNMTTFD